MFPESEHKSNTTGQLEVQKALFFLFKKTFQHGGLFSRG